MIERGERLVLVDAFGEKRVKRALSPVTEGRDFPIVWACDESEWEQAQRDKRDPDPDPFPWPANAVHR